MSTIKQLLETNFYNDETKQFETGYVKTIGEAVITSDGKNVEQKFEETSTAIETAKTEAISGAESAVETLKDDILGGVPEEANTLSKIYGQVEAVKAVLDTDSEDLDTIREITDYIKENRSDIDAIGTNKVDKNSIVSNFNVSAETEGKVLDARVGKIFKDSIDSVSSAVSAIQAEAQAAQEQANTIMAIAEQAYETAETAVPVLSAIAPQVPKAGQLWFRPVGTVQV